MPSKSMKQAKLMQAVAHGWKPKGVSVPVKVAREFVKADKGRAKLQGAKWAKA